MCLHSYKLVEEEAGEQAGIKSCRIDAEGPLCYGLLAGEKVGERLFPHCSALFRTVLHCSAHTNDNAVFISKVCCRQ